MGDLRRARSIAALPAVRGSHHLRGMRPVQWRDGTCVFCVAEHLADYYEVPAPGDWRVVVELTASLLLSNPEPSHD